MSTNTLRDQWAAVAHALASPARLAIVETLAQGEQRVEALAGAVALTVANTSAHLMVLKRAQLVEVRRASRFAFYRLTDEGAVRILRHIQTFTEARGRAASAVVDAFHDARETLEPISASELKRRMRDGEVTVLDVRPAEEFRAGHIAGAVSVPLRSLTRRLQRLPKSRLVIAYCRGPYCVLAGSAVRTLQRHGFAARRFADGFPGWKDDGYPVQDGAHP